MLKIILFAILVLVASSCSADAEQEESDGKEIIALPKPSTDREMSLEKALAGRRSVRAFSEQDLTNEELGQILWAADGVNRPGTKYRTAPSAGALYPLFLYAFTPDGIFRYIPESHSIERVKEGDYRKNLSDAALGQGSVRDAAIDIVVVARYSRVTGKYGKRGVRYAHIEAGHVAQNIHLQAVSLGLVSVPVGAFEDDEVNEIIGLPGGDEAVYIIPVGHPKP